MQRAQQGRLARRRCGPSADLFAARDAGGEVRESPCRSPYDFDRPLISSGCRPEGRFISKRMNGRWIFDRARSLVCSRSTSFLRDVTWLERVPAEKRAMNSFNCAIFFSRCAFCGFDARADLRLRQHHVVIAAGVGDDRLVIDIGDVGADAVQEVAIVRNHDQRALVARSGSPAASGSNSRSRWLVGSSSSSASGLPNSACASSTRTFWPPCSSLILRSCRRLGDIETVEQNGGVALGRVAVLLRRQCLRVRRDACRLHRSVSGLA